MSLEPSLVTYLLYLFQVLNSLSMALVTIVVEVIQLLTDEISTLVAACYFYFHCTISNGAVGAPVYLDWTCIPYRWSVLERYPCHNRFETLARAQLADLLETQ